jgi:hypothetical protein
MLVKMALGMNGARKREREVSPAVKQREAELQQTQADAEKEPMAANPEELQDIWAKGRPAIIRWNEACRV